MTTIPSNALLGITTPTIGRDYLGHQDLSGGNWTLTDLDSSQYNFYEIWMHNYGNASNPAYMYMQIGDGAGGSPTWRTDSTYSSQYRESNSAYYQTKANQSSFGGTSHMSFGYMSIPSQTCKITFSGHKNIGTDGATNGYVTYELEDWRWRHNGGNTNMSIGFRAKGVYYGSTNAYEALRWVYVSGSFNGGTLYYWGIR